MSISVKTACHSFGLGKGFGSTPERPIPNPNLGNALEILGEGVLCMLLTDEPMREPVQVWLADNTKITLTRGDSGKKSINVQIDPP